MNQHLKAYIDFLESKANIGFPLKIACDYSNGPTSLVVRELASRLRPSLDIEDVNAEIHPDFPAHGPDPAAPKAVEALGRKVIETNSDFGVAFDGDGDRAVLVDERGVAIEPQAVAMFLMANIPGVHVADTLVYEYIAHADPALRERVTPSRVGRYFIGKAMRERGASVGAELSGHFFFRDFFGADSGVFTMISVANILSKSGVRASEAFARTGHALAASKAGLLQPFSETVGPLRERFVSKKPTRLSDEDGITADFGDSWVNVRPSNTEPVVRLTAGGRDSAAAQATLDEFMDLFAKA